MVVPVYIAEISPKEIRGSLTALIGPVYASGSFLGLVIITGVQRIQDGWRIPYAVLALYGLVFAIGCAMLPHSPW